MFDFCESIEFIVVSQDSNAISDDCASVIGQMLSTNNVLTFLDLVRFEETLRKHL
jgi:hypothetical protein